MISSPLANLSSSSADENAAKQLQQLLDYCDVQATLLELYQGICDCRTLDSTLLVSGSSDGTVQVIHMLDILLSVSTTSFYVIDGGGEMSEWGTESMSRSNFWVSR